MKNRCKILIVDDDETNREIILEILSDRCAYTCESAEDGEQALKIIEWFRPDIVLLDIMMPGMDGYSVAQQIRENPRLKYVKIIMVSGKRKTQERLAGYDSGADDYLVKPFHEDELLAKIKVFSKLKLAEEVDQIKSTIVSLSAHETRTPLNAIYMCSQLLLDDDSLTDHQREAINAIYTSAKRLNVYIDKVFHLCQLKKGIELEPAATSVQEFIACAVRNSTNEFQGQVTLHHEDPSAELYVDGNLLREAFLAILDNAVKFSPEHGEITISSRIDKGLVQIAVADQGSGIDPDYIGSILDGFSVPNFMHHHQGSGLSLAISRTIIEHHGGELTVANRPEGGATFTITLPMRSGE